MFGVPEALLMDQGTNLLSCLMQDVCMLLRMKKVNTTAHHPQCNGMVERTLKNMLRKHVSKFRVQRDTYLPGVLWVYHICQQVKNPRSCYLDLIAVIQQKLPCYYLEH